MFLLESPSRLSINQRKPDFIDISGLKISLEYQGNNAQSHFADAPLAFPNYLFAITIINS